MKSTFDPRTTHHAGGVFLGVFALADDLTAGLMRMRMAAPFGSISNEFVLSTRSRSFREPKVLGSKSGAKLLSCLQTSPRKTHPSSLSIFLLTFLILTA